MRGYLIAAGGVAALTALVHLTAGHFNPLLPMLFVPAILPWLGR